MADLTEFRAGKQRTGSPTAETGCRFDVAGGVIELERGVMATPDSDPKFQGPSVV